MPLIHPTDDERTNRPQLGVNPVFTREPVTIPRDRLPQGELDPGTARQVVHDELTLDGNARLNLATFVTTWMDDDAQRLMIECFDKNMIDKDEYPRTAELEQRCVRMLAALWHAENPDEPTGCSTTGSSEACMLAGLALKRRWQHRRRRDGLSTDRPNMVMGVNVQVCWEKFANYWDVEARLVPMEGDRYHLTAEEAVKYCDENTIGVVAVLGPTFDGSYEPVAEICVALDRLRHERGWDIPVHVDGASGGMIAPFCDPDLEWDFRLPRVASINTSGHKYGLVYPGVGWVIWRNTEALPQGLGAGLRPSPSRRPYGVSGGPPSRATSRPLGIVGLTEVFGVCATIEDALASLPGNNPRNPGYSLALDSTGYGSGHGGR